MVRICQKFVSGIGTYKFDSSSIAYYRNSRNNTKAIDLIINRFGPNPTEQLL
tara:strand:+ start:1020 stop:1175 length:156 start_codon:yes stop_codon:yes gene_type:complete